MPKPEPKIRPLRKQPRIKPISGTDSPEEPTFLNDFQRAHYRAVMEERSRQQPRSLSEAMEQYHRLKTTSSQPS